ncbi:MAG: DUF6058 family natural product biosynthesis protein [Sphingomonadales bacterium]
MTTSLSPDQNQAAFDYVDFWFWRKETLLEASNIEHPLFDALVEAKAIPGIIYSFHEKDGWWSALAAYKEETRPHPRQGGKDYYSPAALWWIRHTCLSLKEEMNVREAATLNASKFKHQYKTLYKNLPSCYPHLAYALPPIPDDELDALAHSEWEAWVTGAYAVCLRDFSADICLRKEALAKTLKAHLAGPLGVSEASQDKLLHMTQDLASLLLPFAPWERPTATAGLILDPIIKTFGLGVDIPQPTKKPAVRFDM